MKPNFDWGTLSEHLDANAKRVDALVGEVESVERGLFLALDESKAVHVGTFDFAPLRAAIRARNSEVSRAHRAVIGQRHRTRRARLALMPREWLTICWRRLRSGKWPWP